MASPTASPVSKSKNMPLENDWSGVNKKLRKQGLPTVTTVHPADVQHISGMQICLDRANNNIVKENLLSLIADCEHRQTLVQDLISKNNQLKEEVSKQTELAEKYFSQMKDHKIMLESSRARVKELESDQPSEQGLDEIWDEENRNQRVADVFQEFRRRTARAHHTMDDKNGESHRSDETAEDDISSFHSVAHHSETSSNFKKLIRDISIELEVKELDTVIPRIQRMGKQLEEVSKYEQFCRSAQDIVNSLSDSERKERRGNHKMGHVSSDTLNHMLTVLENWRDDEQGMEDGQEHPNRAVLENIVSHFQTLFDVPSVSGVYPRMNQIFTKLGEVHNVLNTLKNLLGLSKDAKSAAIVDGVGRLVQQHNTTTVQQLKTLLQTEDLDGVIRRLHEHQEFFPAFYEIMNKLIEILDLRKMDQVIPAVRALKLLAN
ncbi:CEP70-like protein [Mya arenaria]|uniref:Centrosomal protein of 70 kDa n=1 Tax=Mya arenaria TaxID=6604 RepID=A0ABY7ECG4_MYAAR|nr:CEP70-like protein [Mya arenaria]